MYKVKRIYSACNGNYRFQNEIRDKTFPRIYGWPLREKGIGITWNSYHFYLLEKDEESVRNIVYIDQILNNSIIQDSGTVIGLLEVGFQAIIKELVPFIKRNCSSIWQCNELPKSLHNNNDRIVQSKILWWTLYIVNCA